MIISLVNKECQPILLGLGDEVLKIVLGSRDWVKKNGECQKGDLNLTSETDAQMCTTKNLANAAAAQAAWTRARSLKSSPEKCRLFSA